jgi:hypothetical protein
MSTPIDDPHPLRIVDSITELGALDQGCIAISGSHGGQSSARYALAAQPWLTVFNDAGVGRDNAGIAALTILQQRGLAACTVAHSSACIGQADSTWRHGVVSHVNEAAHALGLRAGAGISDQVCRVHPAAASVTPPDPGNHTTNG